jgi:predicted metal-dependent hydrolase
MKKRAVKTWESKHEFKEYVYLCANKLKVKAKQINLRPMRHKWASCSTNGFFSFNSELLGMDRSLGEYVILHELLHYHVPNHGKLWKSLMMVHMPDHAKRAESLKSITANS